MASTSSISSFFFPLNASICSTAESQVMSAGARLWRFFCSFWTLHGQICLPPQSSSPFCWVWARAQSTATICIASDGNSNNPRRVSSAPRPSLLSSNVHLQPPPPPLCFSLRLIFVLFYSFLLLIHLSWQSLSAPPSTVFISSVIKHRHQFLQSDFLGTKWRSCLTLFRNKRTTV